ncbi:MAG: MerR family transcriptional regulator [Blastocatellia bacterium]|nr:MerR family transcriptional regulator [Blastocatellia bacterium]
MPTDQALLASKYHGTAELADAAARYLSTIAPVQQRGTVTDTPDERTIRYYISEELISEPERKQGTASVFGYRHLLELLVIKRLQALNYRIRAIREVMAGKTTAQLEAILDEPEAAHPMPSDPTPVGFLEGILAQEKDKISGWQSPSQALHSGVLTQFQPTTWQRVEVEPGLEIHVRDWTPPTEHQVRQRLAKKLLEAAVEAARHNEKER